MLKDLMSSMNTGPQAGFKVDDNKKNMFDAYFLGLTPEY